MITLSSASPWATNNNEINRSSRLELDTLKNFLQNQNVREGNKRNIS